MADGTRKELGQAVGYSGILFSIVCFSMILDLVFTHAFVIAPALYFIYGFYILRKSEFGLGGSRVAPSSYKLISGPEGKKVGITLLVMTVIATLGYYFLTYIPLIQFKDWFRLYAIMLILPFIFTLMAGIAAKGKSATAPSPWGNQQVNENSIEKGNGSVILTTGQRGLLILVFIIFLVFMVVLYKTGNQGNY